MQTVFEDARQRSVEMHDMFSNMENNTCGMLNDVEHRMNERESHLMSEIESNHPPIGGDAGPPRKPAGTGH